MGFKKGKNVREKTQGEINRDMWNRLNRVYELAGNIAGPLTVKKRTGIHTPDAELRKKWAQMGGEASIEALLQWQRENGFRVCDLERTEEWCENISEALKNYYAENPISDDTKQKISTTIIENNKKLTKEERSKKFGNDSSSRKSLKVRTEILNSIPTDTFTTSQAKEACFKHGLKNYRAFLKDTRIIVQIKKGTAKNQSVYKKKIKII
jgi:hypothetical protein